MAQTERGPQGGRGGLLRVRPPGAGQRLRRHRPRHRVRTCSCSAPAVTRRPLRRAAEPDRPRRRRPQVHHRLPGRLRHAAGTGARHRPGPGAGPAGPAGCPRYSADRADCRAQSSSSGSWLASAPSTNACMASSSPAGETKAGSSRGPSSCTYDQNSRTASAGVRGLDRQVEADQPGAPRRAAGRAGRPAPGRPPAPAR